MDIPEEVVEDLRKRLRRAIGQMNGVEQMLNDGRDCQDIITQISAASSALNQVGFRLLAAGVKCCVTDPEKMDREGYSIEQLEKMFLKLK